MAKSMYDIIKKQNGEHFAKAIRNYDNGIFDIPDIDKIVKYAGRDAEPIMDYLVSLKYIQIEEHAVHQDPIKLLDMAGYDAYIADTLEKQNAIKKYYASGEELCTFRDQNRFKKYFIINAVRKDVDKIKREKKPTRDGEYGTSVISIQVLKTGGFISIKNRYNHTVNNSDNTLNSDPDNIIPGLADAIKHHFGVDFSSRHITLPDKYTIIDDHIYKYQTEQNNVYCGEYSYAKDGQIFDIDKNSEIMLGDGLLLNLAYKRVSDITIGEYDAFTFIPSTRELYTNSLNTAIKDKKLEIKKNPIGGYDIIADNKQILTVEKAEIVNINIPNAHTIEILNNNQMRGELDFSNVKNLHITHSNLSQTTKIKMPQNAETVILSCTRFPACDLDFSGTNEIKLNNADLSYAKNIKFPKKMQELDLADAILPECELDFSGIDIFYLDGADLSRVKSIKFPKKMEELDLSGCTLPACDLDFSGINKLNLSITNLSHVKSIKLPQKMEELDLWDAKLPACDLDFSGVNNINLSNADLSRATSIKFPRNMEKLELIRAILPECDLDFSGVKKLGLSHANLLRVKSIKFSQKMEKLDLRYAKFPACDLVFGDAEYLYLNGADLSRATSIRFPKKMTELHLSGAKLPACDLVFGDAENLYLYDVDLSHATSIKFPKKIKYLDLRYAILPKCDLDFSGVKKLGLSHANLSRVKSIKYPLKYGFEHGIENILQSVQQKNIRLIQNAENQNDFE